MTWLPVAFIKQHFHPPSSSQCNKQQQQPQTEAIYYEKTATGVGTGVREKGKERGRERGREGIQPTTSLKAIFGQFRELMRSSIQVFFLS